MSPRLRGEVWAVDFDPQTHAHELGDKHGPGKKERPALVIQTDALNRAGHPTTIVIPGTMQNESLPAGDSFPLRVRVQRSEDLKYDIDLLMDQMRSIANGRFKFRCCKVQPDVLEKVEEALENLTGR